MLEKLLKMYYASMLQDIRSPMPHLAGPPGVGKSETIEKLAKITGATLHVVNVSRLSPLEVEGVQMPVEDNTRLHMLHSVLWTQLKEGDIVVFDEFLRGFPEVYNGLLDIMTSRTVAGMALPKVFFVAASNSVTAYDAALSDRLLHVLVPDLRKNLTAKTEAKEHLVKELGLLPSSVDLGEMDDLFREEILPMYEVLDQFTGKSTIGAAATKGKSMRNLIGQVRLREVESQPMKSLLTMNNRIAMAENKAQYVVLYQVHKGQEEYLKAARKLEGNDKLTPIQQANLTMNLQLIEMQGLLVGTPTTTETGKETDESFVD